jgi:hypothetical protein
VPVNQKPQAIHDQDQAIWVLREAAGEAFDFIECYCNCTARGQVAKRLRYALTMTEAFAPAVDRRRKAER